MPDLSTWVIFLGSSLALLAVPGPAVIYLVTRSLDQGRRAGVLSLLGVETGTFIYALAAAAGLTGLIAASEVGFAVVKYLGAAYLVYLGVRKLLEPDQPLGASPAVRTSGLYLKGAATQLLNPKIAIFFLAFLPQFVTSSSGHTTLQILLLGTIFTVLAVLTDGTYVFLAGSIGDRLGRSRTARRMLSRISGVVYIGLGVLAAFAGSARARTT